MKKLLALVLVFAAATFGISQIAFTEPDQNFILKIQARDSFQRSLIANTGALIEFVADDYVVASALLEEKNELERLGLSFERIEDDAALTPLNFPNRDAKYHDYNELSDKLLELQTRFPAITRLVSAGKSLEGRDIWVLIISADKNSDRKLAQSIFMGGHHAREHLSVDVPLRLAEWILNEYQNGNSRIVQLVDNREIHIMPAVNPDGLEHDLTGFRYRMWRKNRSHNSNGTRGVDLNRNYGFKWGTGGSSSKPRSETYMGPTAFSEPETQVVKSYVESLSHVKTLLTYHAYSKLILYPWGHTKSDIANVQDRNVFVTMAQHMAKSTGYKPMQSSDLYIASGDTTDWAYGEHGIFAFTFELDPEFQLVGRRGFYPGDEIIETVVEKNKDAFLYLIESSENPYDVLKKGPNQ